MQLSDTQWHQWSKLNGMAEALDKGDLERASVQRDELERLNDIVDHCDRLNVLWWWKFLK